MNILDTIVNRKQQEIKAAKNRCSVTQLSQSEYFDKPVKSLKQHLAETGASGIIAEFKRKSPSKGIFNPNADVVSITNGYSNAGASALSVLTDTDFFGGATEDLSIARQYNRCPILRKDFIIDAYQIIEAKSIGADAVLLIASILTRSEAKSLAAFATGIGLEVLMEVHNKEELHKLNDNIQVVGVNNRDLKTFNTDVNLSLQLLPFIPSGFIKISESGISNAATAAHLKKAGYDGFLIGEQFMKHPRPEESCKAFIHEFKNLMHEA